MRLNKSKPLKYAVGPNLFVADIKCTFVVIIVLLSELKSDDDFQPSSNKNDIQTKTHLNSKEGLEFKRF